MSRPIGLPKTGGRRKGTPNKKTQRILEVFESLNYDPAQALLHKYQFLSLKDQLLIDLKLMEYIYPRVTSLKVENDPSDLNNPYSEIEQMSSEEKRNLQIRFFEKNFMLMPEDFILKLIRQRFKKISPSI